MLKYLILGLLIALSKQDAETCGDGTYWDGSDCVSCPGNTFAKKDHSGCVNSKVDCEAGTYGYTNGELNQCKDCEWRKNTTIIGEPEYYVPLSHEKCIKYKDCEDGTRVNFQLYQCEKCPDDKPIAKYYHDGCAINALECGNGKYLDATAKQCRLCTDNTYASAEHDKCVELEQCGEYYYGTKDQFEGNQCRLCSGDDKFMSLDRHQNKTVMLLLRE